MQRPFSLSGLLDGYKYNLIEAGYDIESFHCFQDNRHIRRKVFDILAKNINKLQIDSLIVEKSKAIPNLQAPLNFYPRMIGYLLQYVVKNYENQKFSEVIIITDTIPLNKKRKAITKSIKTTLSEMLPDRASYKILHHASKAHYGLQIADYCNWAIFRKWERQDDQYYKLIHPALKSEFDIFETGRTKYY